MTSTSSSQRPARSRAALAVTVGALAALVVLFLIFAGLYTDYLWFDQLGFANVLTTQWLASAAMFAVGFLGMAVPLWVSIDIAYRWRPVYAKLNAQLDRYQQVVEPLRRAASIGVPIVFGFFAGVSSANQWPTVLLWINGGSFGEVDPQFGLDIGFYIFSLPFLRGLVAFASAVVLISLVAAVATSYLYGAIRVAGREVRISRTARIQFAATAALYLLIQGVSLWLDQYSTLTRQGDLITGASYADVNGTIPAQQILAGAAIVVAILFVITAIIGRWRLPIVGLAGLIVASLLIGQGYPALIQTLQATPNANRVELEYIQRNIDATREAYGVADVAEESYAVTTEPEPGALSADSETTASIRIIDPAQVTNAFGQLQQFRQYYGFPQYLDVDRYEIDGQVQDTVIGVRDIETENLGANAQTWVNQTLVYTHGYGVVAAYGNQRSASGQPVFLESGIPASGALGEYEPRVYFGETSPEYSIVGGDNLEFDYPGTEDGEEDATYTYTGDGGPAIDNIFKRVLYAIKYQSTDLLVAEGITEESQILYDRDPADRVQKVAPYLTLDSDAYPAIVDGRIQWVIDAYTVSDNYPYSHIESLSERITDTYTPAPTLPLDDINYIRNSVKATVDAYSGEVTLYAWDEEDPVLEAWQSIFPTSLTDMDDMSVELLDHVRYPADMFKVQRAVLGTYHVTNPSTFYSENDAWITPTEPTQSGEGTPLQPPYYLSMQVPGAETPAFTLYSTFIPRATGDNTRNVLTGYLSVNADAGTGTAGEISEDYGKFSLLTIPGDDTVPAPAQVQNNFNADPTVSRELNILSQGDTRVIRGNLLTLPVGGGLLYVQPVYVQSSGQSAYPVLQRVLVSFGDEIAFETTLDAALDVIFGGDSGADAGDGDVTPTDPETGVPVDPGTDPGTDPATPEVDTLEQALADAQAAITERDAAMADGDWTAYGVAAGALQDAIVGALPAPGGLPAHDAAATDEDAAAGE
ncbi:MAG: UPF0182 family protein [Microbacteriaceae bacterium]